MSDNAKLDAGGFITVGASGHDFDKGIQENFEPMGVAANVQGGIFRGSVSDLAGKDTTISATVEPVSASVSLNSNDQVSSISGGFGEGLQVGAQQTFTGTASLADGIQGGNSNGDIRQKPSAPLSPLQVCLGTLCGKIK